jgi:L-lactate dehydrogenase (cytochrome)
MGLSKSLKVSLDSLRKQSKAKNLQVLSDELETSMRLLGVTKLSELRPDMVNATRLERYIAPSLGDRGISRSML